MYANGHGTFEETLPKLSVNSGNRKMTHKTHTRTNIVLSKSCLEFRFYGATIQRQSVDHLRLICYIFTIGKTHTEDEHNYTIHHVHALVSLFGTSYLVSVSQHG